ncbi:hypothetical protein AC1031_009939 [Aphanomyces cochlioides]|nr:hypothetical protein AC1031_009939 [Aphanomyces cochlioides]
MTTTLNKTSIAFILNDGAFRLTRDSRPCKVDQCTKHAKRLGLCWLHGGSQSCTVPSCKNKAKARGLCWAHGGGKRCANATCTKTALRYGFCWAHGGGKRCVAAGCKRPGYERFKNHCARHAVLLREPVGNIV